MQADGNLVMKEAGSARAVWATNTASHPGAWLAMQDDGHLVVFAKDSCTKLWPPAS
jgi:hypothetical protein